MGETRWFTARSSFLMVPKTLLAASIAGILVTAATGFALTQGESEPTQPRSVAGPAARAAEAKLPVFNLTWNGYYKLGLADCGVMMFYCPAHTYETEPFVEPLAKAGVRVDIPADTSVLEFELRWKGAEKLHFMIHGPMKADHSMPSYMGMGGTQGLICLAIPAKEIVPGMWEAMAHAGSMGPQDTAFTILVNGEGAPGAKVRSGPHGHPIHEEWTMDMKQSAGCRAAGP